MQFVFSVIVLALSSALVAQKEYGGSNSQVNFAVFLGIFSLLTIFYVAAARFFMKDKLGNPTVLTILDGANTIFFFAGGIALAVVLRVHSCSNTLYIDTNKVINGSSKRCHEAQALTAFVWFDFVMFLITAIMNGLQIRNGPTAEMV